MHANLDWATCGECLKPGCFQILASDLHLRAVPGGGGGGGGRGSSCPPEI